MADLGLFMYLCKTINKEKSITNMKKALFLLMLATAMVFSANAQTTAKRGHTTKNTNTSSTTTKKKVTDVKPSKSTFSFLMGWDGLGHSMFSGLSSANDPYATKPWFNSWQLEIGYQVVSVNQFTGFVGIGYESDVYKFDGENSGFIYLDRNDPSGKATMKEGSAAYLLMEGLETEGWESRLCARYVTIPMGVDFAVSEDFGFGLTLVPGFNFTTKNTGLKYKLHGDNQSRLRDSLKGYVNPFKCDVRLNVKFSLANLFLQFSPVPLFKDTDRNDVYPLRFGFMLKL